LKKFEFSLGRMLDYKSRILDEEQAVLQRLKAERDQIQQKIDAFKQEFGHLSARLQRLQREGATVLEVRMLGMQLETIRLQLKELRGALQKATTKVDEQKGR